jgi:DNA polymerase III epsilon subunit-like protein
MLGTRSKQTSQTQTSLASRIETRFRSQRSLYHISKDLNIPIQQVRDIACRNKFISSRLEHFCRSHLGKKIVVFDLETSGLPITKGFAQYYPYTENEYYDSSRILQLAYTVFHIGVESPENIPIHSYYRKPEQFTISEESFEVHKLSTDFLNQKGLSMAEILAQSKIVQHFNDCDIILAHNILFDINILRNEMSRINTPIPDWTSKLVCSCQLTEFTRLGVLYETLFDKPAEHLHDASADVRVLVEIIQQLSTYKKV